MTTLVGAAAGGGVEPHRLQWSHSWLRAELAGAWSGAISAFAPLWQMTENGSTAAVAVRVAGPPPHKVGCRADRGNRNYAQDPSEACTHALLGPRGGLPDYRCGVIR